MLGIITSLISAALCLVVYVRMIRREIPEPMPKKKTIIPVVVGVFSTFLATLGTLLAGLAVLMVSGGGKLSEVIHNPVLYSLTASFLAAGLTEELVKLLLFLLITVWLKPKNVYESAVMLSGIGVGFTLLEEVAYGSDQPLIALSRLPGFAMHMVFGLVMGLFLGLARYQKRNGKSGVREACLGLLLPVL